jgi:hypothetical protein
MGDIHASKADTLTFDEVPIWAILIFLSASVFRLLPLYVQPSLYPLQVEFSI